MKKVITLTIILLILASTFAVINQESVVSATTAEPARLKLYIAPTRLPADGNAYTCIFVQLLDSSGKPARSSHYTSISISSSKTSVGTVDSQILINPGETYGNATFYTTQTPGTTTITAAATDFATVSASITTTAPGSTPTKLVVFCVPSLLPADDGIYNAVLVQLQDSQSRPTVNSGDSIYVNIFSSESSIGSIVPSLTIPSGEIQVRGSFDVSNAPGTTTITAQASNFVTGKATLTTYSIDLTALKVQLTSTYQSLLNGNQTTIAANVTANGVPVSGATVKFSSNNGGTFSTVKTQTTGSYVTTFTAPSFSKTTTCTITASSSKTGYLDSQATTQIAVGPTLIINNTGIIQFCVKDEGGKALSSTVISSTVQPNGMSSLFDITNSTGYVTFKNLALGTYTFRVIKDGYQEMNETINYKGQQLALTVTLNGNGGLSPTTLIIVIAIVVTAAVVSVLCGLFIIRRKRSAKIRKLQDLQKHLKYKY